MKVRDLLTRGVLAPYATVAEAHEWLEELYDRRIKRSSSEQMRLTLEANQIARQARNAARAALIVAIIGVAATIVFNIAHP